MGFQRKPANKAAGQPDNRSRLSSGPSSVLAAVRLSKVGEPVRQREARQIGDQATRRVRDLVHSEVLEFQYVDCACPPGAEETPSCNYGRSCGILKAGGKDVGDILIAEGLAVPFKCGATRCPKTPKPWCEAKPSDLR